VGPREFWEKLAKRSRSNLYFALVFLPKARREAFRDVYRFLRAADDVADSGLAPAEAIKSLGAWRRELDAVYDGSATHPAAVRLAETARRFGLSRGYFETILSALEEDASGRSFATQVDLERWCEAMSSTLGYLCLEILGARSPRTQAYARDLGVALQLANIVRDVDEDAARGRLYLPLDVLASAGCRPEDVLARRYTVAFARVEARLAARVRDLVESARANLTSQERSALLVPEIWADVYLALLRELERHRFDVFAHRPYLRRRKKLALAFVRWVREEPGHLRARLLPRKAL
jgi:15-cis-phytoene synthase